MSWQTDRGAWWQLTKIVLRGLVRRRRPLVVYLWNLPPTVDAPLKREITGGFCLVVGGAVAFRDPERVVRLDVVPEPAYFNDELRAQRLAAYWATYPDHPDHPDCPDEPDAEPEPEP